MPVVNKHTHTPTLLDTYIGRGSAWGNDFSHREGTKAKYVVGSVAEAVEKHRTQLWAQIKSGEVSLESLAALHGRTLVCFCAPRPCHGDTLEKAAAWAVAQLEGDLCFTAQCDHDSCAYQKGLRDDLAHQDQPKSECVTCLGSRRVRSTALAVPGHTWSAQPCPSCAV